MDALRRGDRHGDRGGCRLCKQPVHVACKSIVTGRQIVGLDGAAMVLKRNADSATELWLQSEKRGLRQLFRLLGWKIWEMRMRQVVYFRWR